MPNYSGTKGAMWNIMTKKLVKYASIAAILDWQPLVSRTTTRRGVAPVAVRARRGLLTTPLFVITPEYIVDQLEGIN